MNIVLFEPDETLIPLSRDDPRARHIVEVLRRRAGESFDAGLIDGPRGKARVEAIDPETIRLSFDWGEEPPMLEAITLVLGLPRPQTARKVLEEATALGVSAMHLVPCERGDPGYGRSRLWTTGEWRRHLIAGTAQAFSTRLPSVTWGRSVPDALDALDPGGSRLALDNYEAQEAIGSVDVTRPVTIAVGPERGWSAGERALLREAGFRFVHLGERVLRVETACVAAIAVVRSRLGSM